jgi:hypothetical protein
MTTKTEDLVSLLGHLHELAETDDLIVGALDTEDTVISYILDRLIDDLVSLAGIERSTVEFDDALTIVYESFAQDAIDLKETITKIQLLINKE